MRAPASPRRDAGGARQRAGAERRAGSPRGEGGELRFHRRPFLSSPAARKAGKGIQGPDARPVRCPVSCPRPSRPGSPSRPASPAAGDDRKKIASRPVSRVLYGAGCPARDGHSSGTAVAGRLEQPTRATRGGNAPAAVARRRRPYSVLLPVGFAVPLPLPAARCALTAPFHPCPDVRGRTPGGLLSVALSLESPPPDVIRHRVSVEPGLSSRPGMPGPAAVRPTGRGDLWVLRGPVKPDRGDAMSVAARHDGAGLGAVGAVGRVDALGVVPALVAHHGGAGVPARHLVGGGEVPHAVA